MYTIETNNIKGIRRLHINQNNGDCIGIVRTLSKSGNPEGLP